MGRWRELIPSRSRGQDPPLSAPTLPGWLAGVVARMLPTELERSLLRCCLLDPDETTDDWAGCRSAWGDRPFDDWPVVARRHAGRLLVACDRGLEVPVGLRTELRVAVSRDRARRPLVDEAVGEVLAGLDQAGLRVIVTGGIAVTAVALENADLRHCHDLDLLVDQSELETVVEALVPLSGGPRWIGCTDALIHHRSGLPISLHARLLIDPEYDLSRADLSAGAGRTTISGRSARVPEPADLLVHAVAHGLSSPSRSSLVWVTDAAAVVGSCEVDWAVVERRSRGRGPSVPLAIGFGWLADHLAVRVPTATRRAVDDAAGEAVRRGRDRSALLVGAARGADGGWPDLLGATPDLRHRARLVAGLAGARARHHRSRDRGVVRADR